MINEIEAMRKLDHPYILSLHRTYLDSEYVYLVSDLAVEDLSYMMNRRRQLPEAEVVHIAYQLVSALTHVHA